MTTENTGQAPRISGTAEAIVAETQDMEYRWTRRVLVRHGGKWVDGTGQAYHHTNIRNAVPLIPADVGKLATATNYANERVIQSARLEFDGLYRDLLDMAEGRDVARRTQ